MTEANHYEPVPEQRPHWQAGLQPDGSTPERWFEPAAAVAPQAEQRVAPSRGLIGALLATSLVGAVLGGGGTFLALRETGILDAPVATATPGGGIHVSVQSESSAIIQAVANVGPSVVTIVARQATGEITGSGIVYDASGWVLTNKHVVASATGIDVRLKDGRDFQGTLYGVDTLTDLAIVKIDGARGLSPAPIGTSSGLQVGQLAIAIGSPLGVDYPDSVTTGIVSALGRDVTVTSDTGLSGGTNLHGLIQTDAAINAGNSGGPLVDGSGRVVGVTTTLADTAQGIGFAIPIDIAKPIMQQALAGTKLSRPFIGISYIALNAGLAAKDNLSLDHGAWVHKEDADGNSVEAVVADGPAAQAGIKTGDIITAMEGQQIDATHPLEDTLVQFAPGRTISIELFRGGQYLTVRVTLGTRPTAAA
ncbi:MAG: trypsin-like peptidase domain-containing protein [Candidatus Limnocylindrales bacterium]|jgi:S1-C subfamily serine protease